MAAPPPAADLNVPDAAAAHAVNPTTSLHSAHNHPPFAEMITGAIASLNEPNGSSKMAIAKYIEANYLNPQPTHSSLLTRHLKQLKDDGQILMAKFSYKLPGSALPAPVSGNGSVSVGQKRRRGRPPKNKSVQAAIPVFVGQSIPENPVSDISPQQQNAATGPFGSVFVATGQVNGPVVSGTPRGRGRPPKHGGVKPGQRRTTLSGGVQTIVGKSRGRPKKNAVASPVMSGTSRGRGRPPKHHRLGNVEGVVAAVDSGSMAIGVGTVAGKRRGRPPKAGSEAKKLRKLSGKPLGRHKKTASTAGSQTPVNLQQFAYLDLKEKLQYFQSRIKQTVSIIKPLLNSETALTALRELETLAAMGVDTN